MGLFARPVSRPSRSRRARRRRKKARRSAVPTRSRRQSWKPRTGPTTTASAQGVARSEPARTRTSGSPKCEHCGAALVPDQRYCLSCGQPVSPTRMSFLDALQTQELAARRNDHDCRDGRRAPRRHGGPTLDQTLCAAVRRGGSAPPGAARRPAGRPLGDPVREEPASDREARGPRRACCGDRSRLFGRILGHKRRKVVGKNSEGTQPSARKKRRKKRKRAPKKPSMSLRRKRSK